MLLPRKRQAVPIGPFRESLCPAEREEGFNMEDAQLYELLSSRPDEGMRQLMRQYTGLVCAVIRARFAGFRTLSTDVEDCAADTFSNFWLGFSGYSPGKAAIRTYLAAIARNCAADYLQRNRLYQLQNDPTEDENSDPLLCLPDGSAEETEEQELRRKVLAAVEALAEPDRSLVFRKYYLGKKSKELAEEFGMTPANVDNRVSRAVKKIRESFRELPGDAK